MCEEAQTADITQKTVDELKELKLEHSSYWKTDEELANNKELSRGRNE
jgi:hypothetical protein